MLILTIIIILFLEDTQKTESLCPESEDTAILCLFMDRLFDSVNSSGTNPPYGKELRGAVKKNSIHWSFWREAVGVLDTMEFTPSNRQVPSVKNWLITVKGFMYLSQKLLNDGFSYICLKSFNQDPIENFFGCIRSHGWRNVNPTCANFISSYKSLVINNFMSSQSIGTNCEKDDCYGVLSNLKEFLTTNAPEINLNETLQTSNISIVKSKNIMCLPKSNINCASRTFVAGWVVKKVKMLTNNCRICNTLLTTSTKSDNNCLIDARKYLKSSKLIYPNKEVSDLYSFIIDILNSNIQNIIHKSKVSEILYWLVVNNYNETNYFSCPIHDLKQIFIKSSIRLLIFTYITNINTILNSGKLPNNPDVLMSSASNYYKKYSKKPKK